MIIKSLLVACALSPCLLAAPELQAQNIPGISVYGAGGLSGGGRVNIYNNPQRTGSTVATFTITASQLALLIQLKAEFAGSTRINISEALEIIGNPARFNDPKTVTVTAVNRNNITFTTIEVVVGGKRTTVTIQTPQADTEGTERAVIAAKATLLAGGTPAQATLAARLALAGVERRLIFPFVNSVTILLASVVTSSASSSIPNPVSSSEAFVISLRTKSLDSAMTVIAQTSDGSKVSLNVEALVTTILDYNAIIDQSSAPTIVRISQDERLNRINQSLDTLRALFAD
jgi:hypothetical protein